MKAAIKAISYYLPEQTLDNRQLCELFPELNEQDIFDKLGIRKRHVIAPHETAYDLALKCGEKFFEEFGYPKKNIDFLINITLFPDFLSPSNSQLLQNGLGLSKNIGAMDIPGGCAGYLYGLSISKALIESGQAQNILLITSETPTKTVHPEDSKLRVLIGDGAAATLVSGNHDQPESEIRGFVFGTDGSGTNSLVFKSSGFREPISDEWIEQYRKAGGMRNGMMQMNGLEIFIFASTVVPGMVHELLAKEKLKAEDIDLFIFHQANGYMLEVLRKKLDIPENKFFVFMENVGNTGSASIPIALKEAITAGKAKRGDKILLAGFGVGLSWSATIVNL